jgi:hypothetical protein
LDPVPAFRALLDLPLRLKLDDDPARRLGTLDERARAADKQAWGGLYRDAVTLAGDLVEICDGKAEQAQRRALEIDESIERLRGPHAARKRVDATRAELLRLAARLKQEWRTRLARQEEQVSESVARAADELGVDVSSAERPSLRVPEDQLARLGAYVEKLAREWRAQLGDKLAVDVMAKTAEIVAPLGDVDARLQVPPSPPPLSLPEMDVVTLAVAPQPLEVPSVGAALAQYVRGHIMMVTMFGTMLISVIAVLGLGRGGGSLMLARGWLMLLVLPPSVLFGVFAARRQRRTAIEKAQTARQAQVVAIIGADTKKLIGRHAADLERAAGAWLDEAGAAAERWLDEATTPTLNATDEVQKSELRACKLEARQMADALAEQRTLKTQLSQSILPELRRRARDLGV